MSVLHTLRHSWLLLVLAAVAGGAGGAASLHQQTPVYRSTIQLLVAVRGGTTPVDDAQNRSLAISRAFGLAQIGSTPPALDDARVTAGVGPGPVAAVAAANLSDPLLRIEVTSPDPASARAVATAFVASLPRTAAGLGVDVRSGVSLVALAPASQPELAAPLAWRYLLAGLAAGLGVGLALALLRDLLAPAPVDAEQTAALGGWPLLATVPAAARRSPAVAGPRSRRAEAYRQVLTAALHASPRGVRTVAVVGAGSDDGTADLAANLHALAVAAGHEVVTVDGATTAEQLHALRARGGQDLLLVDAGRVLPRPTAPALLTAVDVVVVVVVWRHRARVREAARALGRLDVTIAGLVVGRGPVDAEARTRPGAAATTSVPVRSEPPAGPLPSETLTPEMHA